MIQVCECHHAELVSASTPQDAQPSQPSGRTLKEFQGDEKHDRENGFTLVELMVVIVILALLSVIVAVNVLPQLGRAKSETAKIDITNFDQAMELYRLNNLNYPTTADGLGALVKAPPSLADPSRYQAGGYIKKLPKDPWGRDYRYESPGKHGQYDIYSLGADGVEGGTGENADIGNW
jgi:general secretion pathway protein G